MTEEQARIAALETMDIKGHNIYFVDFGEPFGYSALVFLNGGHVYYANDYELHHPGTWTEETGRVPYSREELRSIYIRGMNNILFTESELVGPVSDYDEAERKGHYIRNYYPMQKKYISIFGNFSGPQGEKNRRELEERTRSMIYCPVCFAYFDRKDASFVKHIADLEAGLEKARKAPKDSFDYWLGAFKTIQERESMALESPSIRFSISVSQCLFHKTAAVFSFSGIKENSGKRSFGKSFNTAKNVTITAEQESSGSTSIIDSAVPKYKALHTVTKNAPTPPKNTYDSEKIPATNPANANTGPKNPPQTVPQSNPIEALLVGTPKNPAYSVIAKATASPAENVPNEKDKLPSVSAKQSAPNPASKTG